MRSASIAQRAVANAARGQLWLPFLHRLTAVSPPAVTWKNASSALEGRGDLDVIAPPHDWAAIEREFRRWAGDNDLHSVVVCHHVPGSMFLIAADSESPAFFELDLKSRGSYRGTTIFRPEDLSSLRELDARGFWRLRAGAEGLLKLIINGTADDGRLDTARVQRERIVELLRSDPIGVGDAARLFGSARPLVLELARRFLAGEWSRSHMLLLRAALRLRLLLEPGAVMQRLRARTASGGCPGIKSLIKRGRLVPGDATALQRLLHDHPAKQGATPA